MALVADRGSVRLLLTQQLRGDASADHVFNISPRIHPTHGVKPSGDVRHPSAPTKTQEEGLKRVNTLSGLERDGEKARAAAVAAQIQSESQDAPKLVIRKWEEAPSWVVPTQPHNGREWNFAKNTPQKPGSAVSALTDVMSKGAQGSVAGSQMVLALVSCAPPNYASQGPDAPRLTIHLASKAVKKPHPPSITLPVPSDATVETVIALTIRMLASTEGGSLLEQSTDGRIFVFRLTEDDGTPDAFFPPLDRTQPISKFKTNEFALCDNPNANKDSPKRSVSTTSSQGGSAKMIRVRVALPGGESTILMAEPSMIVKDLKMMISTKRHIEESQFDLTTLDNNVPLRQDRTLSSLGTEQLQVIIKEGKMIAARPHRAAFDSIAAATVLEQEDEEAARNNPLFFSEITASKYTEYEVIKTNKRGARQERVMGIDREKIYNIMPQTQTKAKMSLLSTTAVKRPSRGFDEVHKIEYNPSGSNKKSFVIEFKVVGSSLVEQYFYEAKTITSAVEIVAKLKYLLELWRG